jgi:hypothetical protein
MSPTASEINQRIRAAQRQFEQQVNREIQRVNDQNRRAVADYNRKVEAQNRQAVADYNRKVEAQNRQAVADYNRQVQAHNRKADAQNKKVADDINRQLAAAGRPRVIYTQQEQSLVERVQDAVPIETRDYDLFLSYAGIDGGAVATELHEELRRLGLDVWFAPIAINPGKSQSLQMDQGLARARAGVVVLTPAYLAGRFWTQRELGALLHKDTLIPVLHSVTFADVAEYSGILPDLAGFTTDRDTLAEIAAKIAGAVLPPA